MRLAGFLFCLLGACRNVLAAPSQNGQHPPSAQYSHATDGKRGAVASESATCSKIGISLLSAGGNAADALVGTVFCVGVVAPYHSGIGGGGFMLVRGSNGSYEFIDFRETAPAAAFETMYVNNSMASTRGGLASGVPGEVRGLYHLHQKYGKLPWRDVMRPAVDLARNGFTVGQDLVNAMAAAVAGQVNFLVQDPAWSIDFAPNGVLLGLNDTITRKRYADTLETISTRGPDAFYTGPIADATIKAIRSNGGIMTQQDLKNYSIALRMPLQTTYRDYKLTSTGPPSSGVVTLSAMKIIEGYSSFSDPALLNLSYHRLDEAMRWAYAERTQLGDPYFVPGMDEYSQQMISAATAAEIRTKVSDTSTHNVSFYNPQGLETLDKPGTSHIVTADASGMAISLTTTVNLYFGSQVIVPETGVVLNNEMDDFSSPGSSNAFGYIPTAANFIRPGKRPLSSISPTIVENPDGSLYFVVGSAGGSRIITATIQNLWHVLDQNKTSAEALATPRMHDQLTPATVAFEYTFDNRTVAYLKALGSNVSWEAPGMSTAQCLRRLENGTFDAAGEPRQKDSGGFAI